MIGKRMNFFWSNTPMSWMRYMTLASFRRYNPDWEMFIHQPAVSCGSKTWKTLEMDDKDYVGTDHRQLLANLDVKRVTWKPPRPGIAPAHASDLFQWELLGTTGGFYSDMDILYVKPMHETYNTVKDADAVFCLEGGGMAIGFVGSSANCPIFVTVTKMATRHFVPTQYQCAGVEPVYRAAGHWPLLQNSTNDGTAAVHKLKIKHPQLSICVIPDSAFYYYDWISYVKLYDEPAIVSDDCVGLHWFGGSPISQKWNRLLTRDTFQNYQNVFTKYAAEALA